MVKNLKILFFSVFLAGFLAGSALAVEIGSSAPDFNLTNLNGQPVGLTDFKGEKPVMLVFWATWCPLCREEAPRIKELAAEFGPQGLAVIGVNVGINDSPRKAKVYQERLKLNYPVVFDQGSQVTRAYGVAGTPTIIILDRQGVVRYKAASVPQDLGKHFAMLME